MACTLAPVAFGFWDDLAMADVLVGLGVGCAVAATPLALVARNRARSAGDIPCDRLAGFALAAGLVALTLLVFLAVVAIGIAANLA